MIVFFLGFFYLFVSILTEQVDELKHSLIFTTSMKTPHMARPSKAVKQ